VVLSASCYNYFFSEPLYSFEISNEDLPSFVLFTLSASIVAWFVAVRRRIESDLRHARDHGRLRWKSASAEKMKFADSTMTSPSGLGISKRATMN
jgi:K+-sensing histidine kinase KdpD